MLNPTERPFFTLDTGFAAVFLASALALQAGFLGDLIRHETVKARARAAATTYAERTAAPARVAAPAAPGVHG